MHKVKHKVGPEHDDARLLRKELSVSVEEAVRKAVEFPGEVLKKISGRVGRVSATNGKVGFEF